MQLGAHHPAGRDGSGMQQPRAPGRRLCGRKGATSHQEPVAGRQAGQPHQEAPASGAAAVAAGVLPCTEQAEQAGV